MAEKKINWTEQQRRAIVARGSDILVTASAGTGKTAVLSGRCVNIVSDKSVCPDVRSMLVLTFTEMAAEQMRSRIAEQLKDAFLESGNHHLRYQLMLLQAADISTIHSFCKRLITEYFYKLDLDPTFGVIDADEAALLKAEVLEKTIDWAWQQSNLVQPLQQLLCRRDLRTNDGFLAKIIELNNFLEGVVLRESWYERAAQLAQAANPLTTNLGQKQKQIIADRLQHILAQISYAIELYENENASGNWATKWKQNFVKPVADYLELLKAGQWEKFYEEIRNYQRPPRFEYKPKELSGPIAEVIRSVAENARESFDRLSDLAVLNPEYLDRIGRAVSQQTRVLIELVRKFDRLYSQEKRSLNCMDFADLERYALRLLTVVKMAYAIESPSEDAVLPSEVALTLRQRYKYIFVDEYQDINPVQQAILDSLSSTGNVFVVGDVKQSIYAWRGAEPQIFLERLKPASPDPANAPGGLRVDLNANFRSAKGILDFVNKIFSRIMTASFANIDYDQSAHLRPAPDTSHQSPVTGHVVEFHILDQMSKESDSEDEEEAEFTDETPGVVTSRQRQAAMIAQRIRQMVGADTGKAEFQIYDKERNCLRDVQYRDIVVLMRSLVKKANDYVEVLRLAGVPVSCQATAGYFQATEISDILSLLKVLDNPQRDIELAAVLRSPIFNVADTELARIKLHSKPVESKIKNQKSKFWNFVIQYIESGSDTKLAARLKEILAWLERWRTLARRGSLADLIWEVYRQTNFLSFVSALPNGQARRANLLKLHDRAIQFEGFATSAGIPSLTRFVEFLEKLLEAGQDWAPAEPQTAAGNAVRILSVHKSKGLEFPVVFLAELETKFNKEDTFGDCLADAKYTVGLQIIDRDSNTKLRSLAHQVIAEEKLKAGLAEEMRILYVATTRARDRLILTASQKKAHCRNVITNGSFFGNRPISDWQLRSCQSPLEWLLLGLSDQKILHDAFETGLAKDAGNDSLFSFKLYNQSQLQQLSKFVLGLKAGKSAKRPRHTEGGQVADKSRPPRLSAQKEGAKYTCGTGFQDIRLSSVEAPVKTRPRWPCHLLSQIKKSLGWRYQFGNAPDLPAKSSVTQLTHRSDEYVQFDYSKALDRQPTALVAPAPDLTHPVEPRLIGSATHLVISHLDLACPISRGAIEETIEKLLADNAITAAVAERIDTESILAFFDSDLGKMALDKRNAVLRDWPFTFAFPASSVARDQSLATRFTIHDSRFTDDEVVIVQGIIDMLIQTPKGLIVIDFKTDDISASQVASRAELYRQQLELYARAASAILKSELVRQAHHPEQTCPERSRGSRGTIAKWLYFLRPGCGIEIKG
jgi:ATP-dependent helicase/nuclease subunit A